MNNSILWCGFDFGETMQDPSGGYQYTTELIKEIYTKLGKPEIISESLARFDKLLAEQKYDEELMDGIQDEKERWKRTFRYKRLQETNIQKFFSDVLGNDPKAIELYSKRRFGFFKAADGLKECVTYLKDKGISVNVVSEVGSEETLKIIQVFMNLHGVRPYFSEIITNFGRIKANGELDLSYMGKKKIDGAMYKKLAQDLIDIGIQPSQALMIGDRPIEDVERAKENGFNAIQYIGIMKRRISNEADYVISDMRELKNIL